jgi:glycosyltransferase involved in cell wall biosynthesis
MTLRRIMFMINGLGTGGAERSLAELLPALVDVGIEPIVCCLYRRPEGVEGSVKEAGHKVIFLRSSTTMGRILEVRRLIRRLRPDLIHTAIFESDVTGRMAACGMRVPVMSSLVNVSDAPERLLDPNVRRWKLRAAHEIDGWTARRLTNHFHAITHAVKDAAVRSLGILPERVTVVERGRDPERLGRPSPERRLRVRRALGIPPGAEVVLALGRQEYQKGHRHLIDAVGQISGRAGLLVLLAGRQGNLSGDLDRQIRRLRLDGRVRFLGHREDVPDLLAASDMLALPSLYEGLGGVVIEAMGLQVPVVASDLPSLREVTENGACAQLVPAANPEVLAGAIIRLLEDQALRRALGTRGREIFERRFTLERSAERMIALYRSVVGDTFTASALVREGA